MIYVDDLFSFGCICSNGGVGAGTDNLNPP